jgi:hypothetical protein
MSKEKKKIRFEELPQEMQARLVRKLIEECKYSYGVAAYILVGDKYRRGLISGLCNKYGIKASSHSSGFKDLKKGPGGVTLRLEDQKFPTLEELLDEPEESSGTKTPIEVYEAAEEEKSEVKAAATPIKPPASPPAKKYKPPPPGIGLKKLVTSEDHQCEEVIDNKFRCVVEKAPNSHFCWWHQPLDE